MKKIILTVAFVVVCIIITDCSFQKRVYRKGYYVEWKHKKNEKNIVANSRNVHLTVPINVRFISDNNCISESGFAVNSENANEWIKKTEQRKILVRKDTCGDIITLKTGEEYIVKIIEVNDKEIKYRRCDFLDGPLYTIPVHKVYMAKYLSGYTEYFNTNEYSATDKKVTTGNKKEYPPHYDTTMIWGAIAIGLTIIYGLGILIFPFLMFPARKAIREIDAQPNKYKGREAMGCWLSASLIVTVLISLLCIVLGIFYIGLYSGTGYVVLMAIGGILLTLVIIFLATNTSYKH